jgi:Electron transfer DM13
MVAASGPCKHLVVGAIAAFAITGCGSESASSVANPQAVSVQTCSKNNVKVGKTAVLSTKSHLVSGIATVIDDCTIEIKNFNYDGGGLPDVFVYGGKAGNYAAGFAIGPNLFGTRRTNETIRVTLKTGDLDNLDGISIWCVRANVNFGDGLFI